MAFFSFFLICTDFSLSPDFSSQAEPCSIGFHLIFLARGCCVTTYTTYKLAVRFEMFMPREIVNLKQLLFQPDFPFIIGSINKKLNTENVKNYLHKVFRHQVVFQLCRCACVVYCICLYWAACIT